MYVIAEVGINHNGSLEHAKKLIDASYDAGADAVKFQKRTLEICVPEHKRDGKRQTPWGELSYMDYKRRLEFDKEAYDEIDRYCDELGIDWFASCWDEPSLDFIEQYDPPYHKVASAMNTNKPLLEAMALTGRPVILSTGMAGKKEVMHAVDVFGGAYDLSILHCVGAYPAANEVLNLRNITTLKRLFPQYKVGYSNHSPGVAACIAAAALGAQIIEAHITLDRAGWGSDQAASLEPGGFAQMVKHARNMESMLGSDEIKFLDVEKSSASSLRWHA